MENNEQEHKEGIQYYWCVNCGNCGNFKRLRFRSLRCESCGYNPLTKMELEEILNDEHLKFLYKDVL